MADDLGKPLTRFLIALGHAPDLLRRFRESPDEVLSEWGLREYRSLLGPEASLREIQEAVAAEHAEEDGDAIAIIWILVSGSPTPAIWIRTASTDDDKDYPGGGGSSDAA